MGSVLVQDSRGSRRVKEAETTWEDRRFVDR